MRATLSMGGGDPPREAGQVIVLMTIAIVALLAMVGLVIDGGNAYAQQRISQAASDSSAEAGALVLADRLLGTTRTDDEVLAAMVGMAAASGIGLADAQYTTADGTLIGVSVGQASGDAIPANAVGVRATGTKSFPTYVAGVIGIPTLSVSTAATAVAGAKQDYCAAEEGCALLPITPPIDELNCDGSNKPVRDFGNLWDEDEVYKVPLCATGAGNVGWLDWFPPDGGTSDTIASVKEPDNPGIKFPTWIQVSQTGNTNSQALETAINKYSGQPVLLPMFEHTCGDDPIDSTPGDNQIENETDCKSNFDNGQGAKMWYYLVGVESFLLCAPDIDGCGTPDLNPPATKGAYISGSNSICDTGNGATSCLIGKFVLGYTSPGSIAPNYSPGSPSVISGAFIQLIR